MGGRVLRQKRICQTNENCARGSRAVATCTQMSQSAAGQVRSGWRRDQRRLSTTIAACGQRTRGPSKEGWTHDGAPTLDAAIRRTAPWTDRVLPARLTRLPLAAWAESALDQLSHRPMTCVPRTPRHSTSISTGHLGRRWRGKTEIMLLKSAAFRWIAPSLRSAGSHAWTGG